MYVDQITLKSINMLERLGNKEPSQDQIDIMELLVGNALAKEDLSDLLNAYLK